jgi:hypothetical protein
MKRILILTTYKNLVRKFLPLMILLCLVIAVLIYFTGTLDSIPVMNEQESDPLVMLQKENDRLRGVLKSILPSESKTLFEEDLTHVFKNTDLKGIGSYSLHPLQEVTGSGRNIDYTILVEDPDYRRPLFTSYWQDGYYRGWSYLPDKTASARYRLFVYPLGASAAYDFEGVLGFDLKEGVVIDSHHNLNFLVYNFEVTGIRQMDHQIVLTGEPRRSGVQIVSVVQNDLLPEEVNEENFLFQLSTPKGYEIDYTYYHVFRYEYWKKQMEENMAKPSFLAEEGITLEALKQENELLKKEVSYFMPVEEKQITGMECKRDISLTSQDEVPISMVKQKGKSIPFVVRYRNPKYRRPIYDPYWKKNYREKFSYLPDQICLNLHRLFLLPRSIEDRNDLFGKLAFFDGYGTVYNKEQGFLTYSFNVKKAYFLENQLVLEGEPARKGAELVVVKRSLLPAAGELFVRLVTPDKSEVDYQVFSMGR